MCLTAADHAAPVCLLPPLASLGHGTWPFSALRSVFLTLLVKVKSHKAAFRDVRSNEGAGVGREETNL